MDGGTKSGCLLRLRPIAIRGIGPCNAFVFNIPLGYVVFCETIIVSSLDPSCETPPSLHAGIGMRNGSPVRPSDSGGQKRRLVRANLSPCSFPFRFRTMITAGFCTTLVTVYVLQVPRSRIQGLRSERPSHVCKRSTGRRGHWSI